MEMPRSFSICIQSDTVSLRLDLPLEAPAVPMTLACRARASVSVDLPASGCEMTAKVRRRDACLWISWTRAGLRTSWDTVLLSLGSAVDPEGGKGILCEPHSLETVLESGLRAAAGRASQGFKFIAGPEAPRKAGQNASARTAVGRIPESFSGGL